MSDELAPPTSEPERAIELKVAGVTFRNDDGSSRQKILMAIVDRLGGKAALELRPEPKNKHDPDAVGVWCVDPAATGQIGHVPLEFSWLVSDKIKDGAVKGVELVKANKRGRNYYARIKVLGLGTGKPQRKVYEYTGNSTSPWQTPEWRKRRAELVKRTDKCERCGGPFPPDKKNATINHLYTADGRYRRKDGSKDWKAYMACKDDEVEVICKPCNYKLQDTQVAVSRDRSFKLRPALSPRQDWECVRGWDTCSGPAAVTDPGLLRPGTDDYVCEPCQLAVAEYDMPPGPRYSSPAGTPEGWRQANLGDVLEVPCRGCGAKAGSVCMSNRGNAKWSPHRARSRVLEHRAMLSTMTEFLDEAGFEPRLAEAWLGDPSGVWLWDKPADPAFSSLVNGRPGVAERLALDAFYKTRRGADWSLRATGRKWIREAMRVVQSQ